MSNLATLAEGKLLERHCNGAICLAVVLDGSPLTLVAEAEWEKEKTNKPAAMKIENREEVIEITKV